MNQTMCEHESLATDNTFQLKSGEDSSAQSLALARQTRLDLELTQRLDFIPEQSGQLARKKTGNNTRRAITALESDIHKRLKAGLSFVWDRITSSKTESGGDTPTPDDSASSRR